eukprot:154763-Chlamydomonas_euryale.AAC.2
MAAAWSSAWPCKFKKGGGNAGTGDIWVGMLAWPGQGSPATAALSGQPISRGWCLRRQASGAC